MTFFHPNHHVSVASVVFVAITLGGWSQAGSQNNMPCTIDCAEVTGEWSVNPDCRGYTASTCFMNFQALITQNALNCKKYNPNQKITVKNCNMMCGDPCANPQVSREMSPPANLGNCTLIQQIDRRYCNPGAPGVVRSTPRFLVGFGRFSH